MDPDSMIKSKKDFLSGTKISKFLHIFKNPSILMGFDQTINEKQLLISKSNELLYNSSKNRVKNIKFPKIQVKEQKLLKKDKMIDDLMKKVNIKKTNDFKSISNPQKIKPITIQQKSKNCDLLMKNQINNQTNISSRDFFNDVFYEFLLSKQNNNSLKIQKNKNFEFFQRKLKSIPLDKLSETFQINKITFNTLNRERSDIRVDLNDLKINNPHKRTKSDLFQKTKTERKIIFCKSKTNSTANLFKDNECQTINDDSNDNIHWNIVIND